MSYWICKTHGKSIHVSSCKHIKSLEEKSLLDNFVLVMDELSQSENSYISTILCHDCASITKIKNESNLLFDPQIRAFEADEEGFDKEEKSYENPLEPIKDNLTSVCYQCLLEFYPSFDTVFEKKKAIAIEQEKLEKL